MSKRIFSCLLFACFGVTAEIVFTSLKYSLVLPLLHHEQMNWSLTGVSYFWMIFIYGCIPLDFAPVYKAVMKYPLFIRLLIYAATIFLVEYITGFILDITTGSCPWQYTTGWNVSGYIRLDYFPFWMLFGFLIEKLYIKVKGVQ